MCTTAEVCNHALEDIRFFVDAVFPLYNVQQQQQPGGCIKYVRLFRYCLWRMQRTYGSGRLKFL
jgi:hypothetical protein